MTWKRLKSKEMNERQRENLGSIYPGQNGFRVLRVAPVSVLQRISISRHLTSSIYLVKYFMRAAKM